MSIISVSRRTDIPAFYGDWFLNRIKEGFAEYYNPFNYSQKKRVSLHPEDVDAFVFWSKNFEPFLNVLKIIKNEYNFVMHYTITGLPKIFEPNIPEKIKMIEIFKLLSNLYGNNKIFWRFDPIILSNITPENYIIETFEEIAEKLKDFTFRCYVNFVNFYNKVNKNFLSLQKQNKINIKIPSNNEIKSIILKINAIAKKYNITVLSCSNKEITNYNIKFGSCVDAFYIYKIFNINKKLPKINPTRDNCHCYDSRDIGTYDTCPHHCLYCYANTNEYKINNFYKRYLNSEKLRKKPALFW